MRRNFLTNLSFLLLLNLLVKPFWILGIDRTVQNRVGADAYGTYFALFSFSFLFQVVLDFGINNFNNRQVARDPQTLGQYFATTLLAKGILSVLYTLLVFICAFSIHFTPGQISLLALFIIMQILLSFYTFLRSNVSALQLFKTDAVLSVLDKLITSSLCAVLIWGGLAFSGITVRTYIWAQITGYSLAVIVAALIVLRQSVKIRWEFRSSLLRQILKNSYPYALLGFLMTAYYRIDSVMIVRMVPGTGAYEAGLYASAFRLLDALNILGFLFAGILLPSFARMLEHKENIRPLLTLSYRIIFILAVTSGIAIIFYRQQIMQLLYLSANQYSGNILGWLMVSFIFISMIYIYGSLLTANGSIRNLNLISGTGMVLNIVLNAVLIPHYKALGSAAATVITQGFVLLAHVWIAGRVLRLPHETAIWMRSLLFAGMLTALQFLITRLPFGWPEQFLCSLAAGVLLAFASGMFRLRDALQAVREMRSDLAGNRNSL